jgi:hypothetical protein
MGFLLLKASGEGRCYQYFAVVCIRQRAVENSRRNSLFREKQDIPGRHVAAEGLAAKKSPGNPGFLLLR